MIKILGSLLKELDLMEVRGDLTVNVSGLTCDSRKVKEGDLFIAVRGTRQDGHHFIEDAIGRGARAVVAESIPENGVPGNFVRVRDTRKALAGLAVRFYENPSRDLQLIGVTGTNGKTTTTLLLESILRHAGHSVGVLGTIAYRWAGKEQPAPMTTPDSLDLQRMFYEMLQDRITHVVMEVSSHALALGRVEGCLFKAGVFTNLSQDHLDFHPSMEEYFDAKAQFFRKHLHGQGGPAAAVINRDDPYGERLIREIKANVWSYSMEHADAHVTLQSADLSPSGTRAEFSTPHGTLLVRSSLIGRLNVYNMLAASTAALAMGVPRDAVAAGLEGLSIVNGRLQRVPVPPDHGCEVVVDYAHTPDAMEKSLGCLREMTEGRLIVVFGCGGDRDRKKRPLMGEVAARLGDLVILTSDNPRSEAPERIIEDIEPGVRSMGLRFMDAAQPQCTGKGYTIQADRRSAIELALSWACPGDTVFIGGKGHETYQIVGGRVLPFDDRTVVENYFKSEPRRLAR